MSSSSSTPGTSSPEKTNWQELYILSKHWKSDLEFFKQDLRFLQHLVDKYIIWITKKQNLEMVTAIQKKEHDLSIECDRLINNISDHLYEGRQLIENSASKNENGFKKNHLILETKMAQFVKTFRENRKEVFKVTEYVMDSEELKSMLHS